MTDTLFQVTDTLFRNKLKYSGFIALYDELMSLDKKRGNLTSMSAFVRKYDAVNPMSWLEAAQQNPRIFRTIRAERGRPADWPAKWPWKDAEKWTLLQLANHCNVSDPSWSSDMTRAVMLGVEGAYQELIGERALPEPRKPLRISQRVASMSWLAAVQELPGLFDASSQTLAAANASWPLLEKRRDAQAYLELHDRATTYGFAPFDLLPMSRDEALSYLQGTEREEDSLRRRLMNSENPFKRQKGDPPNGSAKIASKDPTTFKPTMENTMSAIDQNKDVEVAPHMLDPFKQTGEMLKEASKSGVKIGISSKVTLQVISKLEEHEHYPAFMRSEAGRRSMTVALPMLVHFITSTELKKHIPGDKYLRAWSEYAATGAFSKGAQDLIAELLPFLAMLGMMVKSSLKSSGFDVDDEGNLKQVEMDAPNAELELLKRQAEEQAKELAELRAQVAKQKA